MDLNKKLEKKLDGTYTRMLRNILNNNWRKTNVELYGNIPQYHILFFFCYFYLVESFHPIQELR